MIFSSECKIFFKSYLISQTIAFLSLITFSTDKKLVEFIKTIAILKFSLLLVFMFLFTIGFIGIVGMIICFWNDNFTSKKGE